MSDSVTASVASGNSPQPASEVSQSSDYNELQSQTEEAMGLESDEMSDDSIDEISADAAQSIDEAAKKGDISKTQAQELKKKLKLKVDGQEYEEEIDFNDDENLKKHFQKSKAFDKRVSEFQSYKAQVDQLLKMLDEDPEALLEKMGKNVDELAEKRLTRKVEELKKSPEQLEREKMESELKELRDAKKKADEDRKNSELERMRNEQAQQIETDISSALDSTKSMLPKKNPLVLQRITSAMLMAMKNGYPNVTAAQVIPLVEKQWKQELNEFFNVLPEDTLEMLVGKNNFDRVRKSRVSQQKAKTQTAKQIVQETGTKVEVEDNKPKKRMRDFFRD
jgi:hypothetical protein